MTNSNEALALLAANGDRAAYERLVRAQYDRIFSLAWRLLGNFHEAQDLTQDICLSLPKRLRTFKGQASLNTWLYRVVVNAVHDRRRASATRSRYHQEWGEWELNRIHSNLGRDKACAWLTEAMSSLPADLSATLALSFEGELTQAQIATILDIPTGTIAWRISQVKKHLRHYAQAQSAA